MKNCALWLLMAMAVFGISSSAWAIPVISDSFDRPDSSTGLGTTDQGYSWQIINWNGVRDWSPGIKNGRMWWEASNWNQNNPITLIDSGAVLRNFILDLDYVTLEETGASRGVTTYFRCSPWQLVDINGVGYGVRVRQANYNNVEVILYNSTYGINQTATVFTGAPGCHLTIIAMENNIRVFINNGETAAIDFTDTTDNPGKNAAGYFGFYDGNATDRQGFDNLTISHWPAPTVSDSFNREDNSFDLGTTDQGYAWGILNITGQWADFVPGIKNHRLWWAAPNWNYNNVAFLGDSATVMKNFDLELTFVTSSETGGDRPITVHFRMRDAGGLIYNGGSPAGYAVGIKQENYNNVRISLESNFDASISKTVYTGGPGARLRILAVDNNIRVFVNDVEQINYTDATTNPARNAAGCFSFYNGNAADQQGFDNLAIWARPVTASPTFSPRTGYFSVPHDVTLACTTEGAIIRYTVDGSDPTSNSLVYQSPISVTQTTTIKAQACAPDMDPSAISSATFTFPTSYGRPATVRQGTATIDGQISEWAAGDWVPLDVAYDLTNTNLEQLNNDIAQAAYAVRWTAEKLYVAVKVQDLAHHFSDTYDDWNRRDAVEIYVHTTGYENDYFSNQQSSAQQYAIGIKTTNTNDFWTTVGGAAIPEGTGFVASAKLGTDGWIYYEAEITPYEYYGGFTGQPSVSSPLSLNDVIGLDVVVAGHNGTAYTGMKGENDVAAKWNYYTSFGLHKLITALMAGDANGDGMVDVGDLGILATNYGGSIKTWSQGDFNGDGLVDVGDLGILAAHYGEGSVQSASFSEDYAKAFGTSIENNAGAKADASDSVCSALGLPLVAGFMLVGLMLLATSKLED